MSFRDTLRGMLDEALEASGVPRQQPINYPRPVKQPTQGQRPAATRPSGREAEATGRPRRREESRPEVSQLEGRPHRPTPSPEATPTDEQPRAERQAARSASGAATLSRPNSSAVRREALRRTLASPAGVQQALILGEILGPPLALRPPDDR